MKRLVGQFDTGRLTEAVATPTCSSCCCCCCCLTTAITSSTLLTKRIALETKNKKIKSRGSLLLASALFIPISLSLAYFTYWTIARFTETCTYRSYYIGRGAGSQVYEVCTGAPTNAILPLVLIVPTIFLAYLYTRAKIPDPIGRSIIAMILISIATVIEAIGGAFLILSSAGIGYLIMVPFFHALILKVYNNSWLSKPLNASK